MDQSTNPNINKSLSRALDILDFFFETNSPASISEVCKEKKINVNTASRLLNTLTRSGYLVRDSSENRYKASLKILRLAHSVLNSFELRRVATPYLEGLWKAYQRANVNLAVLEDNNVLSIDRIESANLPRIPEYHIGKTRPLHATALGKILICDLSRDRIRSLVGPDPLTRFTKHTIVSLDDLCRELEKVRKDNIAYDRREFVPTGVCAAAPIRDKSRKIVAALSLSVAMEIHMSFEQMEKASDNLNETADSISRCLGYG